MVERFLAKEGVGVRFPLPAPRKHPIIRVFSFEKINLRLPERGIEF